MVKSMRSVVFFGLYSPELINAADVAYYGLYVL